ncbi:Survival factor 1 [Escovopsis weberi]|uniref:Survival factor 1 n=1 Tax=Escovopsis weberi TaxID=150374 RepID=A0A0M8MTT3_ESCWE|nr:Survival factor 1 [Escovopsis weberi]
MFRWAQKTLADVAGTAEPEYGSSAIKPVGDEAKETKTPYTELTRDDLKWLKPDYTCVETNTFYFFTKEGRVALAQVICSNVAGIKTTCQFNLKVFARDAAGPHLWCSNQLSNVDFGDDMSSYIADDCAVELSPDGNSYTIKSMTDERAIVNLKVTRLTTGFHAGKTGRSLFGTDLKNPWGSMRHAFWPRCAVEGTITTEDGALDMAGRAIFIYALQGMKPHHAAARWNFATFCGPTYSAMMMEFTTPPSYGSTVVNVGAIVKDGELVAVGCTNKNAHKAHKQDGDNGWPEPTAIRFEWLNPGSDGKPVEGVIDTELGPLFDRVDVMAEVPGFVKKIVSSTAGTKPYIYQFVTKTKLELDIGGEKITEEGQLYTEATFISEI